MCGGSVEAEDCGRRTCSNPNALSSARAPLAGSTFSDITLFVVLSLRNLRSPGLLLMFPRITRSFSYDAPKQCGTGGLYRAALYQEEGGVSLGDPTGAAQRPCSPCPGPRPDIPSPSGAQQLS